MKKTKPLVLEVKISARTLSESKEKLERLTKMFDNLSKDEVCKGISRLQIKAEIV